MSFARTKIQRMTGVGSSCLAAVMRLALILVLSFSVVCVDPYSDVAAIVSVDEATDVADHSSPSTSDPDAVQTYIVVHTAPDRQFEYLSAERLKLARNWRVACVFEARGPPA